jgi:hypothetical protein
MLYATIDRLKRLEDEQPADRNNTGGAAAEM